MIVVIHDSLKKRLRKASPALRHQFQERVLLFIDDQFHSILNNHPLRGKYVGSRSINITGDYRAIYIIGPDGSAVFYEMDTHHNLYRS